jgi:hypothetical protein
MDDPTELQIGAGEAAGALFTADFGQFLAYVVLDIRQWQIGRQGKAIIEDDRLRGRRAEKLRQLHAGEVFPAGSALLAGPDGRPDPRPVVVAVTEADLVLLASKLDSSPEAPDEEIARIPRGELTGARLLDERGEPATPLTDVEELDAPAQRYLVWVEREIEGRSQGNAFVFLSYGVAAEAERDLRRQIPSTA